MSNPIGWECPRCHRAYAPEVEQCKKCPYEGSQLFTLLRGDTIREWDTGTHYRFNGMSGGDEGPRQWSIREVGEGKGIIDGSGHAVINTDLTCYCHPCVRRRNAS
jgi:hypothetical protein